MHRMDPARRKLLDPADNAQNRVHLIRDLFTPGRSSAAPNDVLKEAMRVVRPSQP
jgi:hypothetical protein